MAVPRAATVMGERLAQAGLPVGVAGVTLTAGNSQPGRGVLLVDSDDEGDPVTRTARKTVLVLLLPLLLLGLMAPPASATTGAPAVPTASGEGRRIVYGVSAQRVWLMGDDGTVERSYRVSGKRGTPRPGTYRVFSKSERAFSTGGVTMRWMVRFTGGSRLAIGFHDIPRSRSGRPLRTEAQLGTYRSHGCVRQATADAKALYDWAPVGTTVVVVR